MSTCSVCIGSITRHIYLRYTYRNIFVLLFHVLQQGSVQKRVACHFCFGQKHIFAHVEVSKFHFHTHNYFWCFTVLGRILQNYKNILPLVKSRSPFKIFYQVLFL
jgi:hypothetical protein